MIVVPPNTPIVRYESAARPISSPARAFTVRPHQEARRHARGAAINVGRDGVVPQ